MNEKYHAFKATVRYTEATDKEPKAITGMAVMPKLGVFHNFIIIDSGKVQTAINMQYIISIECNLDGKYYTPLQEMEADFTLSDRLKAIEIEMKTKEIDRAVSASNSEAPNTMY
tara:strand:+ start:4536 stop:4877 length:342 start_codon:yes stop_codon:yes gene_type:complete